MKNHNLITARKKKKLTLEELAKMINVANKSVISNWENGRSKPRIDHAFKIAKILDSTVDELFREED